MLSEMPVVPFIRVFDDGKLDAPRLLCCGSPLQAVYRQLPPKVIKCAPKVVQGIANKQAPAVVNDREILGDEENLFQLPVVQPASLRNGRVFSAAGITHLTPKIIYMDLGAI
jgi:hypothetical protein